jgi:hypothetical protein
LIYVRAKQIRHVDVLKGGPLYFIQLMHFTE